MAYPDGMFSWADLATTDVDAAKAFYAGLMGWEPEDQFAGDHLVYTMMMRDGNAVAGVAALSPEMQEGGTPPIWTSYVNVDDVDAVAAAFAENGGSLLAEPMDVMDAGRMAYGFDPTGAGIGFWQPGNHAGAGAFNDPGYMTWNELQTRDVDAAIAFYESVLPWNVDTQEFTEGFVYSMIMLGDRPTGGIMAMGDDFPAEVPPNWSVWFRVADCEASAAKAQELGGTVIAGPFDTPQGRGAVISDPQGGIFSIIGVAEEA